MLNLTPFCWQLERRGDTRLDLLLYTAPGGAPALLKALPPEWKGRMRGRSAVRFTTVPGVAAALRALEPGNADLLALVKSYEELRGRAVRGVGTADEDVAGLRAVCFALMNQTALVGHLPRKRGGA